MDRENAILDAAISLCRCQDEAQLQYYITRLQDVDPQFYGEVKLYLRQNAAAIHTKYDMDGEQYPDMLSKCISDTATRILVDTLSGKKLIRKPRFFMHRDVSTEIKSRRLLLWNFFPFSGGGTGATDLTPSRGGGIVGIFWKSSLQRCMQKQSSLHAMSI
jgi:hypothetical protein